MARRVLLIGYGFGGRIFHAPFIAADPAFELSAIVTSNPERQAQARAEHPQAVIIADPYQALSLAARNGVEVVVVSTPDQTHVPYAEAAINEGLHVVIDKPAAQNATDLRYLGAAATARGKYVVPFHNRRYDGDFRTVRKVVASRSLGTILRFESRFERWRPTIGGGWRDSKEKGSGVLLDLGTHLVDQAVTLFGPVKRVQAIAQIVRANSGTNDHATITLDHANGVISQLQMSAVAAHYGPRFRVLGTEAAFVTEGLDPQEDSLLAGERPTADGPWGIYPPDTYGTLGTPDKHELVPMLVGDYRLFWRQLAEALDQRTAPPVTVEQALTVAEVLDAARQSAAQRQVIALTGGAPASSRSIKF
jgi:scyllo-inositol 2-dehydrogenase (NADP+)